MPQKPTCFFSYSRDSNIIDYILRLKYDIEKKSSNKVRVILDHHDFKTGDNYKEKERQIFSSDLVVLFLTPEYKKKVDDGYSISGVRREFDLTLTKYTSDEKCLFPILLKGERTFSIPSRISDISYTDSTPIKYSRSKSNKILIDRFSLKKHFDLVSEIIKATIHNNLVNDVIYTDSSEKYNSLLKNTAADGTLRKACMIKMPAYAAVMNQTAYFVIGRKGSGKSTLMETVERLEPSRFSFRYKRLCTIKAEHINIGSVYETSLLLKRDRTDIPIRTITDLYWELLFIIHSVYIVCLEFEADKIPKHDHRYTIFQNVRLFFRTKLGIERTTRLEEISVQREIPTLVFEILENYIKRNILTRANEEAFITSIKINLNALNLLNQFFEKTRLNSFINALKECSKKILISLDGFDSHSEDFRRATRSYQTSDPLQYSERSNFESLFYRSLTNTVKKFKTHDYNNILDILSENIDFCIVLPQDRLDQIKDIDRDISKTKCCGLFWDIYDLMRMLTLRLEDYYGFEYENTISSETLETRFYKLLSNNLPRLPHNVTERENGEI